VHCCLLYASYSCPSVYFPIAAVIPAANASISPQSQPHPHPQSSPSPAADVGEPRLLFARWRPDADLEERLYMHRMLHGGGAVRTPCEQPTIRGILRVTDLSVVDLVLPACTQID